MKRDFLYRLISISVIILIVFLTYYPIPSNPEAFQTDLLERLKDLPGVEVTEIEAHPDFLRTFAIDIIQPVDHQNPDGQKFTQRIYLNHRDESAPLVFEPSGYGAWPNWTSEIADVLNANNLQIAHRYCIGAEPQTLEWQYLNIKQAAADHHHIVEVFKQIYKGNWISSGHSLSGMKTLFHRRFYPEDVQATIAYVSPIMFSTADPWFDHFLEETVGNETCRNKIKQFQRTVLENKATILPLIKTYLDEKGYSYPIGEEAVLEFAVLEYLFYFWQNGPGDCNIIPDVGASAEELFSHLSNLVQLRSYTEDAPFSKPVYYQIFTELGYYRLITEHLEDLIMAVTHPSLAFFAPKDVDLIFKPEVMQDINTWLQTEGNNIIYIYGAQDPYTACAIELTDQTNALKIVQPGANHSVFIADLDAESQQLIYSNLNQWLNLTEIEKFPKIITNVKLSQNYPNPFNPSTIIEFDLPSTSEVSLKIFNILGEEVATLVSGRLSTGSYSYEWNAGDIASGVYLYRLEAGEFVETRKMVVMR